MSPDALHLSSRAAALPAGAFVAVVGPSGVGKDTLIARAAADLAAEPGLSFTRRIVTRPADRASEDHDSLDENGFRAAEAAGAFCLTWRAHGLAYALPSSALAESRAGRIVVANVSRRALGAAMACFPALSVVEITAARDLLIARIAARGP